jgi:hypothetical protein
MKYYLKNNKSFIPIWPCPRNKRVNGHKKRLSSFLCRLTHFMHVKQILSNIIYI